MQEHFLIRKKSQRSKARLTLLKTAHGNISGPFFMPVATRGSVRFLSSSDMRELGSQILLANTYHLFLRPGITVLKKISGIHQFMNWDGPVLTDSGGYQIFSLARHRRITPRGVHFIDPQSGTRCFLSPEKAMQIQEVIGSDIRMVLDECPPYPSSWEYAQKSLRLTTRWAQRCKRIFERELKKQPLKKKPRPLLFGIVQGSTYADLRIQSAREIVSIGFDGYAIGGVAVGEPREKMKEVLKWVIPLLPENAPRYLMGLGRPQEILFAVGEGVDMFDCVIPTREARHGRLYLWKSEDENPDFHKPFYTTINITQSKYAQDYSPINHSNLKSYSKAYLHHLFRTGEPLGMRLATLNNLHFYLSFFASIRRAIRLGNF